MRTRSALRCLILSALLVAGAGLGPASAFEVWTANEGVSSVSIIPDPALPVVQIPLFGSGSVYGLAFSTYEAAPGGFAFVSQGPDLHVIDADLRVVVSTLDVAAELGVPRSSLTIRGLDAALTELFDQGGQPVGRVYLYAAADLIPPSGTDPEPWFLVFSQNVLVSAPPGISPLVASGPLLPGVAPARESAAARGRATEAAGDFEAMEVKVLGSSLGTRRQRALFTVRESSSPERLFVVEVGKGELGSDPWQAREPQVFTFPAGSAVPEGVVLGAPFSRELPLLPLATSSSVRDIVTGRECAVTNTPRSIAISGSGLVAYSIWVPTEVAGAPNDELVELRWSDCSLQSSLPVGKEPVDVDVAGVIEGYAVFVANRASDTVSYIETGDPHVVTDIALGPAPIGTCTVCPRSIAWRRSAASVCRAKDLRLSLSDDGSEFVYTWTAVGCAPGAQVRQYCQCLEQFIIECPDECRGIESGGAIDGGIPSNEPLPLDPVEAGDEEERFGYSSIQGNTQAYYEPSEAPP